MVGPNARPGARGLGPGMGLKYESVLLAWPRLDIVQFAGRARDCTTAAGPGRAWASNHICGPGLGLDFRPVQGPNVHTNYLFVCGMSSMLINCVWTSMMIDGTERQCRTAVNQDCVFSFLW